MRNCFFNTFSDIFYFVLQGYTDLAVGAPVSEDDNLSWEVLVVLVKSLNSINHDYSCFSTRILAALLKACTRVKLAEVTSHCSTESNNSSILNLISSSIHSDNHSLIPSCLRNFGCPWSVSNFACHLNQNFSKNRSESFLFQCSLDGHLS